jgi:hypothetical protein
MIVSPELMQDKAIEKPVVNSLVLVGLSPFK